jgi:hypothetical protein
VPCLVKVDDRMLAKEILLRIASAGTKQILIYIPVLIVH